MILIKQILTYHHEASNKTLPILAGRYFKQSISDLKWALKSFKEDYS